MVARRPRAKGPGSTGPASTVLGATTLRAWPLPDAEATEGKEERGCVLVVGGKRELAGAIRLAGEAALRAGAGKLQLAAAASVASALAVAVPESLVVALPEKAGDLAGTGRQLPALAARADALVLGPGAEAGTALRALSARLLQRATGSVVLDAGAIDLGLLRAWRRHRHRPPVVMTPHHGEMAALLGCDVADVAADAARIAVAFAREWGLVVVLKAATTWIADADGTLWVNRGGTAGLGTSGSGDVLAGLIGGLSARGATPAQAACWAVWLHARAGERLTRRVGLGFLAREIAGEVPALMQAASRRRTASRR